MTKGKIHSQAGMTLMELLVTIVILALVGSAMVMALPVTARAYQQITASAEAASLTGTLSTVISNELRFATDIQQEADGTVTYTSGYGKDIQLHVEDGQVMAGEYRLLAPGAYTSGSYVALQVGYDAGSGLFDINLQVYGASGNLLADNGYQIRALNQ